MPQEAHHLVLEARLQTLASRIEEMRRKLSQAKGVEGVEEAGAIEELESRHKKLRGRVETLNREGPSVGADVKAELEAMADDLSSAVEDFMIWADSGYAGHRKPQKR